MLQTVKVCAMSVPPQLERDFGNPARFYSAISLRQKKNPVFLARLLRPRPSEARSLSKFLNLDIAGVRPASKGHLIVALISFTNQAVSIGSNPAKLSILSHEEIPLEKNENVNRVVQLPTSTGISSATRDWDLDLLLIIAFHPLLPDRVEPLIDALKAHLKEVFANSHCPQTGSEMDPTAIHICALDIHCRLARLEKCNSNRNVTYRTTRKWMWPLLTKRQEIILSAQPRVDLVLPHIPPIGSLMHANVEVKWSSFEQPTKDANSSSSSSSSSTNNNPNALVDRNLTSLQSPGQKLPDGSKKYLVYHYMYKDPETQLFHAKREVIDSVQCIWCGSFFGQYCKRSNKRIRDCPKKLEKKREFNCNSTSNATIRSVEHLMFHLRNCHYHFEYHPMRDQEGNLFIFMMRDRSQDLSADSLIEERRIPFDWFLAQHRKDRKSLLHQDLAIIKVPQGSLQPKNKLKGKADMVSKEIQLVATRQYYHPRTGLPIVDEELGYESDDECDNRWDLMMANQALDEFEDIGYEEKVFMKLWNTHIASFPPYSDGYIPIVCERFVRKFSSRIADEHLRYHCLFHFLVMHDFGLLRSDEVQYYMTIVDRQVKVKKDEDESTIEL